MKKKKQNQVKNKVKTSTTSSVRIVAKASLPSKYGSFSIYAFSPFKDSKEHIAIVKGNVARAKNVPTRIHSECLTGDALGSLRCDCGAQLDKSLSFIGKKRRGLVFYLRQEGRGIGLVNKIRAYELQDKKKVDTYDANVELGFAPDERSFAVVADMLRALEVQSINLMTNNPSKIIDLRKAGIKVNRRLPHDVGMCKQNKQYLLTKKERFGHLLSL